MKKVILSVFVVGALLATSCKKAKEEAKEVKETTVETVVKGTEEAADKAAETVDKAVEGAEKAVDKAVEAVESALEGVSIPSFGNEKVEEHLKNYASYAKEYIAAKGDVLKNAKLAKKGVELAAKGKELMGTLDAEGVKKFNSVMSAIQSKMAPAK